MPNLILVNENDQPAGEMSVLDAHLDEGKLHRAFTALLINSQHQVLVTQRSLKKPLWPTFWDGSFSSHPVVTESLEAACVRRSTEELGIQTSGYRHLFKYSYHFRWNTIFSEYEVNHILVGTYDGEIKPNPDEIMDYKWLSWDEITTWIEKEPEIMAPWWTLAVGKMDEKIILTEKY